MLEWASTPVSVVRTNSVPLWALTTSIEVGSPISAIAGVGFCRDSQSSSLGAPRQPTSSS